MKNLSHYIELAARIHVFLLLNLYGIGKIIGGQFYHKGALPADIAKLPLEEVRGFDLMWTFMGYSYTYILFIGISQIIGAWLLLFNRTKLLGVTILIPILANIIILDFLFFENSALGALGSATIYFALLMLILWINRQQVISVLQIMTSPNNKFKMAQPRWKAIGIALGLVVIIFSLEQLLVNFLGH